jgi:poly(A) polymerase
MIEVLREALGGERAWLVGGALRDRLLGRPTPDLDVVVDGDVRGAARRLGRGLGGASFELSDQFGAWRIVARDRGWQVDLTPLQGGSLEADLGARDLTVNAMAEPLSGGELVDPFGGARDLAERRLRMVSSAAFAADPLRTIRVARLATELRFEVEPATADAVRAHADGLGDVSPERVFAELRRIVAADDAVDGVILVDELGLTAAVLPELTELRGVEQTAYHHRGVHGHTLEVLQATIDIERDPSSALGADDLAEPVQALLAEPLADQLTRGGALRFGALLHDVGKPQTRGVRDDGRVTFMGHDRLGQEMVRTICRRLRTSERLCRFLEAVTRHHLVLGFLVHERPLDRRAVYRYLERTSPVEVEVTLLSVADRLATRGKNADRAIDAHLELAGELMPAALEWRRRGPPPVPVRGDELAEELGIDPGPELGRLLDQLAEATYAGEATDRQQAIDLARILRHNPE